MGLDVKVTINLKKPLGNTGTEFPLIVSTGETAIEFTICRTLAEVKDKFATTTNTYKAAELVFMQTNAPDKIGVVQFTLAQGETLKEKLEAIAEKGWRQFMIVDGDTKAVSMKDKLCFASVANESELKNFEDLERIVGFVHTNPLAAAALIGETAGRPAGSFTYKTLILTGIPPMEISDTKIDAIHTAGGITFVTKAGDNVTSEGKTTNGEYIDIVDSGDFIIKNIAYKTQKLFNNSAKIPYDNTGIAMLESATVEALRMGYNNGMIATNDDGTPAYAASFALRSQTTDADRKARKYPYGWFKFILAGAVHEAEIQGDIIV